MQALYLFRGFSCQVEVLSTVGHASCSLFTVTMMYQPNSAQGLCHIFCVLSSPGGSMLGSEAVAGIVTVIVEHMIQ